MRILIGLYSAMVVALKQRNRTRNEVHILNTVHLNGRLSHLRTAQTINPFTPLKQYTTACHFCLIDHLSSSNGRFTHLSNRLTQIKTKRQVTY
jgi:hypothetical protein